MTQTKNILPFFLPAVTLIVFLVFYPVLRTIYISFLSPSGQFVGLDNYSRILASPEIVNPEGFTHGFPMGALIHNIIWIGIHLPLSMFTGLALAILLRDVKGASIVKSIIFLGMVTPLIVGGLILRFTFEANVGIISGFFQVLGIEPLARTWTAYPETALFALIFGSVWLWTGFSLIVYSAGLTTIPKEYYEAAKIDGASRFRTFFRITFPLLKPITLTVVTMTVLWELKIFDIVYVATRGGPGGSSNVLAYLMYQTAFQFQEFNDAAVIATLLTILTLISTVWLVRYLVKK